MSDQGKATPVQRVIDLGVCTDTITRHDGTTEVCNQVHQHCTGHLRDTAMRNNNRGDPCRKNALVGGTACASHGGGAKQVRAANARRVAKERVLGEVGQRLAQAQADVEGLTLSEQMMMGINHAGAMALSYRWLLDELPQRSQWSWVEPTITTTLEDGTTMSTSPDKPERWVVVVDDGMLGPDDKGNQKLHAYEEGFRHWTRLHGQLIKDAVTLGLEERRQQFRESQVRTFGQALRVLVQGLGRELDDPVVVPLVEQAVRTFASEAS